METLLPPAWKNLNIDRYVNDTNLGETTNAYTTQENLFTNNSLLENSFLISVIKDFQHRLLIDVEIADVKSININIDFWKLMLN